MKTVLEKQLQWSGQVITLERRSCGPDFFGHTCSVV
jgi:hypothetical protein